MKMTFDSLISCDLTEFLFNRDTGYSSVFMISFELYYVVVLSLLQLLFVAGDQLGMLCSRYVYYLCFVDSQILYDL